MMKRLQEEKDKTWIVSDNQSLRNATSPSFKCLLCFNHSKLSALVPTSHTMANKYVVDYYQKSKSFVTCALGRARRSISISLDGWLADNQLDMLGITAHYLDEDLRLKTVLLRLRPMYGSHSGSATADELLAAMRKYRISDRIGYFVADNTSNNDAALHELAKEIEVKPVERRIRCQAHNVDLVAKAVMYGTDIGCVMDRAATLDAMINGQSLRSRNEVVKLAAWRRKGAFGITPRLRRAGVGISSQSNEKSQTA